MAKVLEFQLQHHSFQRNPRADLLQSGLVGSPCSPRDSQESSPTPQFKASILRHSAFFTVQLSHPYMTTGKTIALTCREPARDIPLMTKVMRKEARHTQRRDRASGVPPDILEHLPPKNQSLPTLLLCALTSDFTGGCPPPPSRSLCQRVNLQLQLIKFLGN